jgi:GNAT superfamily N-acetyltransferase
VNDDPVYPRDLQLVASLSDGTLATIRAIRPEDAEALSDFHDHLSSETVYRRFFSVHPHLQAKEVRRFTTVDYRNRLALVVEVGGRLSAVGRYDREPGRDRAEVAFVVADALQGHGVGALLLEHLAGAARRRGVASFVAQTLGGNYAMQHVFRHAGFNCVERWTDGVIEVSFPIAPTQRYLESVIQRDAVSVRARLANIPRTGKGGLGLVVRTEADAAEVIEACRTAAVAVSLVLVTDTLQLDATEALLYLGWDSDVDVVACYSAGLQEPRRFVTIAREVGRGRPLVAVVTPGLDVDWADQAGVDRVAGVNELVLRAGDFLAARRDGTWAPPYRGQLVEVPGCDVALARSVLDQATPTITRQGVATRLAPDTVGRVLAAYAIVPARSPRSAADGGRITLADDASTGLAAHVAAAGPARPGMTRLLPLTDQDATELVEAAGLGGYPTDAAVDSLLRAARLLDDQPDVRRIEVAWPRSTDGAGGLSVALWTGRDRGPGHDPFVRRLLTGASART